jgi:hypothetical protein
VGIGKLSESFTCMTNTYSTMSNCLSCDRADVLAGYIPTTISYKTEKVIKNVITLGLQLHCESTLATVISHVV